MRRTACTIGLLLGMLTHAHAIDLAEGKSAPAFDIPTLPGGHFTLESEKGRVLVINFWATWCTPCRQEMPALEALYRKYHKAGVDVVAVSVDDADQMAEVAAVMKAFTFPAALSKDSSVRGFGRLWRIPVTFVIDQQGVLRRNGWEREPLVDEAILERIVAPLLAIPPSGIQKE